MKDFITNILIYCITFVFSAYSLQSVNFEKFVRKNKEVQTGMLYIALSMSMAWIIAQFLINFVYYLR